MTSKFFILIIGIFCVSLIFEISESYSETREITIVVDPSQNTTTEENTKNTETSKTSNSNTSDDSPILPTEFVNGSEYALNGIPIFINTDEGIALNEQLIDQIELEKLESIHGKNFWDRVETLTQSDRGLVNALLNPQSGNSFFSGSGKHEINPNSNLEYYILERGFNPENTNDIPNRIFSPEKYDLARAIAQKLGNSNSNELNVDALKQLDLRLVSPHTFEINDAEEYERYTSDIQHRANDMLRGALSGTSLSHNQIPGDATSNDFTSSESDDDPVASSNTKNEEIFQNTEHIKKLIKTENFSPNYSQNQESKFLLNYDLFLLIIPIIATLLLAFYLKNKKKSKSQKTILVKKSVDYTLETEKLLIFAQNIFLKGNAKDAFEKFSYAIRFYYSNKLGLEKEITSSELLEKLKNKNNSDYGFIRDCLILSGNVEFAKDDSFEQFSSHIQRFAESLGLNLNVNSSLGDKI
jgi:hypothetical protein